jgi:hypothetical protein
MPLRVFEIKSLTGSVTLMYSRNLKLYIYFLALRVKLLTCLCLLLLS